MNKILKNKYILLVLTISVILIGVGVSYSLFSEVLEGEKNYVINVGNLQVLLDETATLENIIQDGSIPMSDTDGKKLPSYNFSLINNEITDLSYTIYIVEDTKENKTPSNDIKLYYTRDYGNIFELKYLSDVNNDERKVLETGIIPEGETFNYTLKMWVASTAGNEILGTSYSCHLEVEATQVIDDVYADMSGASYPELKGDLIPVVISDTGSVTKADLTKKWYDYDKSEWANAVILEDNYGPYNDGDTIPEEAIESYFVWIPRYRYKIFDEGNYPTLTSKEQAEQEIEIRFEDKSFTPSTGSTVGTWLTHPAFTAFDSDGFWVGKFESGYRGATSTTAQQNVIDVSKLIVKPNVYSWRGVSVGNAFKTSYEYNRELDSHLMKNTEWGAVAYLSHSKYGNINKRVYSGNSLDDGNIRYNNNSGYVTGYSSSEIPTKGTSASSVAGSRFESKTPGIDGTYTLNYFNLNSINSSTTRNYSGIYDMSGGCHEYVMGNIDNTASSSGITTVVSDFYTNDLWSKYYDKYPTQTSTTIYSNRILGDATGEMGPFYSEADPSDSARNKMSWYGNSAYFVFSTNSWFSRGGLYHYGTTAGIFTFARGVGEANKDHSFRLVLVP